MQNRRGFLKGIAAAGVARAVLPTLITTAAVSGLPALGWAQETDYAADPSRPGTKLDALRPFIDPTLEIFNPHTQETVRVRFFTPLGYDRAAVQQLNHIWRDWRQDVAPQIDPRLFWGLAAIRTSAMKEGHDGVVTLLSGYRTLATTRHLRATGTGASLGSQHMKAAAMDIHFHDIPASRISGFAEWLQIGGTGYYPRNNFTHADTGSIRQWKG